MASGSPVSVCHLSHSTRPKGPRTQNTLHWTRFLPSTMHADPKSLVSLETRPGLLGERHPAHPNDITRTSNNRRAGATGGVAVGTRNTAPKRLYVSDKNKLQCLGKGLREIVFCNQPQSCRTLFALSALRLSFTLQTCIASYILHAPCALSRPRALTHIGRTPTVPPTEYQGQRASTERSV